MSVLSPAFDVDAVDGVSPDLLFLRVPETKELENRLHLDLRPDDQDAEVERLIALGASHVDIGQGRTSWVVLADPRRQRVLRSAGAMINTSPN
jgi:hypothetical protein